MNLDFAMSSIPLCHQKLLEWLEQQCKQGSYSPTMRQMQDAMGLKSHSPIQNSLNYLKRHGYLTWTGNRSKCYRVLKQIKAHGLSIKGSIAAHSLLETFPDEEETFIDFESVVQLSTYSRHEIEQWYALRVRGDSMIGANICDGDLIIMKPCFDPLRLKEGEIVAAHVNGQTTLKHFHRKGRFVLLKPANPKYPTTTVDAIQVNIQGIYVGLIRGLVSVIKS